MVAVARWKEAVARAHLRGDPLEPVLIKLGELEEAQGRAIERLERIGGAPVSPQVMQRAFRAALSRELIVWVGVALLVMGEVSGFAIGWLAGHVPWACVGR
jgi:hypothetical protein